MARVAVVTGASSGVGRAAAKALAMQGWRVIGQGRDAARTAEAEAEIRAAAPGAQVDFIRADLASMAETARLADAIAGMTDRVDVLLNNAGGMTAARNETAEGNEASFAGNHLGHFLLTSRLLPLLRAAAADAPARSVRIISTASDACAMGPGFNWDDLQLLGNFNAGWAYCNAKLANVLYTRGLAARLAGEGIVANAVHPGTVASNFASHADEATQARLANYPAFTPEEGADTLVWAATSDEAGRESGLLFYRRAPFDPGAQALDDANVDRLWAESERIVGVKGV